MTSTGWIALAAIAAFVANHSTASVPASGAPLVFAAAGGPPDTLDVVPAQSTVRWSTSALAGVAQQRGTARLTQAGTVAGTALTETGLAVRLDARRRVRAVS